MANFNTFVLPTVFAITNTTEEVMHYIIYDEEYILPVL